jgi:hypothetical protein
MMVAMLSLIGMACGVSARTPASPTPVTPAAATWPNEPSGLTLLTDWGFDVPVPASGDTPIPNSPGWWVVYEVPADAMRGMARLTSDSSAPLSPSSVYDFVYPEGMVEGVAPATVYYNLRSSEIYAGFWWKPSSPFDLGPNGNKVAFLFNGGGGPGSGGQQVLIMLPDRRLHVLPEYPGDFQWRRPNVNATAVTLGEWHRVEWLSNVATGSLQWWLDGVLQGSHDDVRNGRPFDMFQFSPTWGGNTGARKRQMDHYWFDHVRLSIR